MNPEQLEAQFNQRFLAGLSAFLVTASFCYIGCITFLPVPKENQRFADTVLGFLLGTLLGTVLAFFFGSSKSSQTKDSTIKTLAEFNPTPPPINLMVPPTPPAYTVTATPSPTNP